MNNYFFRLGFSLFIILIAQSVLSLPFFVSIGIGVFAFIFLQLVHGFGKKVPIKELMSFIVFLQLFISPLIAYQYFDNQATFIMYVDQNVYMTYILPALISFSIGLHFPFSSSNLSHQLRQIRMTKNDENIAISFIVVGFVATFLLELVPGSLRFILYLMMLLKFIGSFMLIFSRHKYKWIWIFFVYGQFTIETIRGGVFYDLFVWIGFLYMLIEIKLQSSFLRKMFFILIGGVAVYFIQSIKGEYREMTWQKDVVEEDREEVFFEIAANQLETNNTFKETTNFDRFISRLNTGWIISKVMEHTPRYEPFTNGDLLKRDLVNVFLPRFLFPNKDATGGKQNQEKFTRFTGRRLIGNTTMRIGAFSDAYVNFGIIGGWLCMFGLGILFNLTLIYLYKLASSRIEFLLWIPFIFAYAIRMSDLQVILNYTFKAFIFVIIINYLFISENRLIKIGRS